LIEFLDIVPGVTPWTFVGLTVLSFFTAALGVVAGLGGGVLLIGVMATIFPPATLIPLHGTVLFGTNVGRAIIMRRMVLGHLIPAFALGALGGALVGGQLVVSLPRSSSARSSSMSAGRRRPGPWPTRGAGSSRSAPAACWPACSSAPAAR